MTIRINKRQTATSVLVILSTQLLALVGMTLLYHYDNKYTTKSDTAQGGAVSLPIDGVSSLVDGWELYPDMLLSPDMLPGERPPTGYATFVGQYPNLSTFHEDGNPYGVASYRLRLRGNGMVGIYLQEPLCAVRLLVDGVDMGGAGNVNPQSYQPLVRDTFYSFEITDEVELILHTANYSHYYGGIWYPPLIGSPDAVGRAVAVRMVFYGLLCFSSLALAIFCSALWLDRKAARDPATFWFGLLCLGFAIRVCYPFLRMYGVPLVRLPYMLEDTAALLIIYCALRIVFQLCLPKGFPLMRAICYTLGLGMCGVGAVVPMLVLPAHPSFALWYGQLISWYKLLAALFIMVVSVAGVLRGALGSRAASAATAWFAAGQLASVVTLGRFEPLRGGWAEEYGAFGLVLVFGGMMVARSHQMTAENRHLNEHLQQEVEQKTNHLQLLLTERGRLMAELSHDMKSPLTSLSNMAQIIRTGDILLEGDAKLRLSGIEEKCGLLTERLDAMQQLAGESSVPAHRSPILLNVLLRDFYTSNRPVVEMSGPDLTCRITEQPCMVRADREQLLRALENLVYNAADFTPPEGQISLSLERDGDTACITVTDTGCGIDAADLPRLFDRAFTTRSEQGGQGLGLPISRGIVREHGGELTASSVVGKGSSFVIRLPIEQA